MPRRTAAQRHTATAPPRSGPSLIDAVVAFHHPVRRRLFDTLASTGPASVGMLAKDCGIAAGSASHHLGVLHRNGWIEPASELATDTRESWWRARRGDLTWTSDSFPPDTAGSAVLHAAQRENLEYEYRAVLDAMTEVSELPAHWQHSMSAGVMVRATSEQLLDLIDRLDSLVEDWRSNCVEDQERRPDAERRPVRVIARAFPSGPSTR